MHVRHITPANHLRQHPRDIRILGRRKPACVFRLIEQVRDEVGRDDVCRTYDKRRVVRQRVDGAAGGGLGRAADLAEFQ